MPTRIRPRTACAPADDLSNPIPEEFCDHLGFVLARARLELIRGLDAVVQPSGLQARHFALVRLLLQRPGLSQAQISALLGTDRTTTMKMADDLERRALVSRKRSATDRRANTLSLTPQGERWIAQLQPALEDEEARFLEPLSPGERALLQELLVRLVQHATTPNNPNNQHE